MTNEKAVAISREEAYYISQLGFYLADEVVRFISAFYNRLPRKISKDKRKMIENNQYFKIVLKASHYDTRITATHISYFASKYGYTVTNVLNGNHIFNLENSERHPYFSVQFIIFESSDPQDTNRRILVSITSKNKFKFENPN